MVRPRDAPIPTLPDPHRTDRPAAGRRYCPGAGRSIHLTRWWISCPGCNSSVAGQRSRWSRSTQRRPPASRGTSPAASSTTLAALRLFPETEGNPLFVVEMARAGWTSDSSAERTVSRKVQTTIEARARPAFRFDALRDRPRDPDYHYVVTCTTRQPRPGEVPGVSYQFLTDDAVPGPRRRGRAPRVGRRPRQPLRHAASRGRRRAGRRASDVILKIDVQGAPGGEGAGPRRAARVHRPADRSRRCSSGSDRAPPRRPTSSRSASATRRIELARQGDYDQVVVNETGEVDRTAAEIEAIIEQEKRRNPDRRMRIT